MTPLPEVVPSPKSFWGFAHPSDGELRANPKVHPYKPDWFADCNPQVPSPGSPAISTAFAHPACACELLLRNYPTMAQAIEPALNGSAHYTFRLMKSLAQQQITGRRHHYRQILLPSPFYAASYAQHHGDPQFMPIIDEWAAGQRDKAAAASWHLVRHPKESIAPYRDLLQSYPSEVYWALPDLYTRGFLMRPADKMDPQWAYYLALSAFSRDNGNYLPALRRDPVWLVGYLLDRDQKLDRRLAAATAAQLRDEHGDHPLLARALTGLGEGPAPAIPAALAAGQQAELDALERMQRGKNRTVYRPSLEQVQSELFKRIVGPPRYTERGYAKGTVMDVVDGEFAEIKSGRSVLEPTYQLRLQAYRAEAEERRLRIYTNRPVSAQFAAKILTLGVAVEPLPE